MRFTVLLSAFIMGCMAVPTDPQLMTYEELTDLGFRSANGLLSPGKYLQICGSFTMPSKTSINQV